MNTKTESQQDLDFYQAFVQRNAEFEGVFFAAVKTTGIFCRPTCPAKRPKLENVEFYSTAQSALSAGYRPCKRCQPTLSPGATPGWLEDLLERVEDQPDHRWTDVQIREQGFEPARVRRWFKNNHGMTFHAYLRAKRLGNAMNQVQSDKPKDVDLAYSSGYESLSGFNAAFKKQFGNTPGNVGVGSTKIVFDRILTPLGPMLAAAISDRICMLEFADRDSLPSQINQLKRHFGEYAVPGKSDVIRRLRQELEAYFSGSKKHFSVPMISQGSEFQKKVWKELGKIPYGQTVSYETIATSIGRPGACRAVGRANGENRIAILIPCHRVIRNDGSISGYGGGVWRKRHLLDLEQNHVD